MYRWNEEEGVDWFEGGDGAEFLGVKTGGGGGGVVVERKGCCIIQMVRDYGEVEGEREEGGGDEEDKKDDEDRAE